jgi:TPR repeat protein
MSELNEPAASSRRNPLIWVALAVVGLIVFVFFNGERGGSTLVTKQIEISEPEVISESADEDAASGTIERSLLVPPGMRARQYIEQVRADGKPYPLTQAVEKAQEYLREGSLADAHLLFFFAAREEHLPAVMQMAEMSDPTLFRAEDSLLDHADVIQAYKWYQKAASLGQQEAVARLENLQQWASDEAEAGNPHARQLLLNFQ